jgi:hypothetical protein
MKWSLNKRQERKDRKNKTRSTTAKALSQEHSLYFVHGDHAVNVKHAGQMMTKCRTASEVKRTVGHAL